MTANPASQEIYCPAPARVVIVTGMSGAGRTSALKALEDMGYEAVDNLPLSLLTQLVRPGEIPERPLAAGIDIRTRDFGVGSVVAAIDRLISETPIDAKLLFLDADDEVLARRFTETRRRHPLATDRPLADGIRHERALLAPLKERADLVIDSSRLAIGEFRHLMETQFSLESRHRLVIFVTSFSYRQGLPREADLVFDARFLANPHYVPELKPLSGRDAPVAAYVANDPSFNDYFDRLTGFLAPLLPRFAAEGKSYLTIGIGCTGGRHRSVFVAERLADWLMAQGQPVELRHRDLTPLT
ncbi:MAG: RNase adapter RapZ [Alphaproteobacteria bacterium]|nr:RNase adapter RapZ [Alphaproteobacteria bacterium]